MKPHATIAWLSVFTSTGTLVCCALPALLVALGAGAVLSGVLAQVPQLVWLSEYKLPLFGLAGAMLAAAGALQWRARQLACPPDAGLAAACSTVRDGSLWVFGFSVLVYVTGFFFAFVLPWLTDE
jgi:hypothetical protein